MFTDFEIIKSVDMSGVLDNFLKISAFLTNEISQAVEVPEDIPLMEKLLDSDNFINSYIK